LGVFQRVSRHLKYSIRYFKELLKWRVKTLYSIESRLGQIIKKVLKERQSLLAW
jgi:hypothetical protein